MNHRPGKRRNRALKKEASVAPAYRQDFPLTKKSVLIISLLLGISSLLAFAQLTRSEFITYDDPVYVTDNPYIQNGLTLEGIGWALTATRASNWHPLTWISHMIDVQLFGFHAGWHHLANLLLHLVSTVLLFLVLFRMTEALWQSAFVAALFALHPLHVESVAWVAERKDVLSTFLWLLTMWVYVSYAARPGVVRYLSLIACLALGLMAKPMLVTLPFVLLLLDYWPLRRMTRKNPCGGAGTPLAREKRKGTICPAYPATHRGSSQWLLIRPLLVEKVPLFVLVALSSIITYLVQRHGGAMMTVEALPPEARLGNVSVSYIAYIVKMFWPTHLAVLYPLAGSRPIGEILGAAAALVVITVLAIKMRKKYPYAAVGWLWYLGTLVPVIGIVQVGDQSMADRYTYIPLIGLFIIVAYALPDILKSWYYRRQTLIALSLCCLLCLLLVTWRQVGYWQNSITLYTH